MTFDEFVSNPQNQLSTLQNININFDEYFGMYFDKYDEQEEEQLMNKIRSVYACGKCNAVNIDPKEHVGHCVFLTEPNEVITEHGREDYDEIPQKCALIYAILRKIHYQKNIEELVEILFDFASLRNRDLYAAAVLMSDENTLQDMMDVMAGKEMKIANSMVEQMLNSKFKEDLSMIYNELISHSIVFRENFF